VKVRPSSGSAGRVSVMRLSGRMNQVRFVISSTCMPK